MIIGKNQRSPYGGLMVMIDNHLLDPRPSQKLVNHSPDGFNWGYGGSAPAQLALALLLWFRGTGSEEWCLRNYQQFKWDVIAKLPQGRSFALPEKMVREWMRRHR